MEAVAISVNRAMTEHQNRRDEAVKLVEVEAVRKTAVDEDDKGEEMQRLASW